VEKPYITTSNGVARADRRRLLDEQDRQLSNKVKRVEDPVLVKQEKLEVGNVVCSSFSFLRL